jgi:hypothetical protein
MRTQVGIFHSPVAAEAALQDLRSGNFSQDQFILLTPEMLSAKTVTEQMPTPEPPGACGANVGQVSGAITGFASGIVGGALISLAIPGLGPIIAIGTLALGGSLGAVAGGIVGNAVQTTLDPVLLPEEQFIYEDALRQGEQVLIVQPNDDKQAELAGGILHMRGAKKMVQAREQWWQQLRTNEENAYTNGAEPFSMIEARYRQGFEAALDTRLRERTHEEKETLLAQYYPAGAQDEAFRHGFTRGEHYYAALVERGDPRRSTTFAAMDVASPQS